MAEHLIDDAYLRSFFGIPYGEEGDAELADLRSKLKRETYSHG